MPLFPSTPVVSIPPTPVNKTDVIVDTASIYSNIAQSVPIIGYLDGSPQTCNYYNQYLTRSDVVINSNDVTDPTLKQYLKITNFELRVTQALSSETNASTGTSVVTGAANIYPVLTPVVGDLIILEISDGNFGIFEVTATTRASQFKESSWSVTYSQIGYTNPNVPEYYDAYVVANLIFDPSLLNTGSNPLKTTSEYLQSVDKNIVLLNLIEEFYVQFYDYTTRTFILPAEDNTQGTIYDPFVVNFWNTYVSRDLYPNYESPTSYDTTNALIPQPYTTVFDAVIKQSSAVLTYCQMYMKNTSVGEFDASYQRHTLRITPIDYVVFPNIDYNNDGESTNTTPYIFSDAFYTGTNTAMSPLELQITKVINRQVVLFSDIQPILANLDAGPTINKFYAIPFLIILLMLAR